MCARRCATRHVRGDIATYRHIHRGDGGDSITCRSRSAVQAAGSCHLGDEAADFQVAYYPYDAVKGTISKYLLISSARE